MKFNYIRLIMIGAVVGIIMMIATNVKVKLTNVKMMNPMKDNKTMYVYEFYLGDKYGDGHVLIKDLLLYDILTFTGT